MKVLVINGPNLDRLGKREPEVYGKETLEDIRHRLVDVAAGLGVEIEMLQSNHEGEIIEMIHATAANGIVINPGAFGHTSFAIADALRSVEIPTVEVHVSNVREREPWRAVSVLEDVCVATIYGRGTGGYLDALRHLVNRAAIPYRTIRYGPHPDNVGDLRTGQHGLVVLVHGGFWRHRYRRDGIESLAVDLTRRGFHTWNIEYRLLGSGGGWPGSGHDVLTALDFTPQLGLEGPLMVIGHSAGGYLAIWAASRATPEVARCVGLAPVVHLEDGEVPGWILPPETALLRQAGAPSPVDPGGVPTTLVHGAADDVVPLGHSTGLAADDGVELKQVPGGHFELLDPTKPHWEWVVERLRAGSGSTYLSTDR